MTLDHLIATVPDLRATHAKLLSQGFAEAWPPGPFWPAATTSGIALGGANLELVQPDGGVAESRIETLVFAPATEGEGSEALRAFDVRRLDKTEPDPERLALRGFPPEMRVEPQLICENLYPREDEVAYPFFLCTYAPFLKERLSPRNFVRPRGPIVGLSLLAPDPGAVHRLFAGWFGTLRLDVDPGDRPEVAAIRFADGSLLTVADL